MDDVSFWRTVLVEKSGEKKFESTVASYGYYKERVKLNKLIDDIYENNKEKFASREDIFIIFAKAALTGRLLEVAHLIDSTFGKGSFSTIAEETKK